MVWLQRQWLRLTPWHIVLFPVSILFALVVLLRRNLYHMGLLRAIRLSVPVVVVGNISVGGTGKTPLVIWLADFLRQQGYHPGIISRGYGGSSNGVMAVDVHSNPAEVGDEPLLLATKSACPVWIGSDRVAAGQALLRVHPECDVLLSDDGLQHYRLDREVEIAVVDGERQFGNGLLLPAGPLRERISRLRSVDAVVVNGLGQKKEKLPGNAFEMRLVGDVFINLHQPALRARAVVFQGKRIHAVAGIGNPQRFFAHLRSLGLTIEEHAFPDHYDFKQQDLDFGNADMLLMTEKDAIKCADFADERYWSLAVEAILPEAFGQTVLQKLRNCDGRETA